MPHRHQRSGEGDSARPRLFRHAFHIRRPGLCASRADLPLSLVSSAVRADPGAHLNALMQMSSRTRRCWAPKSTSATSTRAARGRHSGRGSRAVAPPSSRECKPHGSCSVWPAPSKDRAGRFDLRAMPSKVNPGSSVVMDHFVCAAPPPCPAPAVVLVSLSALCAQEPCGAGRTCKAPPPSSKRGRFD